MASNEKPTTTDVPFEDLPFEEMRGIFATTWFKVFQSDSFYLDSGKVVKLENYESFPGLMDSVKDCFNMKTGVYTVPCKTKYKFKILAFHGSSRADVEWYLCGSDGRREHLTDWLTPEPDDLCPDPEWEEKSVIWECDEGVGVWVEVKETCDTEETPRSVRVQAGFHGSIDTAILRAKAPPKEDD